MELPLVVGVDGSDPSLLAVDWAAAEAARHGLPLRLVHASLWERYEGALPSFGTGRPAEEVMAQHIVASGAERVRVREPEVKVSTEVLPADPVAVLLAAAPTASALVTGVRGRGEIAGLLLGSVSLAVAARAECPVVVVRGTEPAVTGTRGRIVAGVGESAGTDAVLRFAAREARAHGCGLTAVRAWHTPAQQPVDHMLIADDAARSREERALAGLDEALRETEREHPALEIERRAVEGPTRRVLLEASAGADLIVVGAVRREGRPGLQLGRIAHTLLHHARCPVAVVPHGV
ncbi:universal stress protein [Streptomyces cellostaticus]|uniref:universal stress protein n=1 Tax=Streptomyces cellostaticus TaxID=67285 RepID=UPI0020263E5F|nr:universal stress protein [Streptomyces cellostaticus]